VDTYADGMSTAASTRPAAAPPEPVATAAAKLRCDAIRNRERILAAAAELYREHGGELTIEQVAHRAGVGIGTVYRRFGDKAGLLDELARPFFEDLLATARAAREHPEPGERLEVFVREIARRHAADGVRSGRLWDTAVARPLRDEYMAVVEDLLADARAGGRVRADVNAHDVGVAIWALAGLIDATGQHAEVIWRRFLDLMLDGLRPGGDTPLATRAITRSDWDALSDTAPVLRLV
jgi:AcrR family transcriptional regulator